MLGELLGRGILSQWLKTDVAAIIAFFCSLFYAITLGYLMVALEVIKARRIIRMEVGHRSQEYSRTILPPFLFLPRHDDIN